MGNGMLLLGKGVSVPLGGCAVVCEPVIAPFLIHRVCKQQLQTSALNREGNSRRTQGLRHFIHLLLSEVWGDR